METINSWSHGKHLSTLLLHGFGNRASCHVSFVPSAIGSCQQLVYCTIDIDLEPCDNKQDGSLDRSYCCLFCIFIRHLGMPQWEPYVGMALQPCRCHLVPRCKRNRQCVPSYHGSWGCYHVSHACHFGENNK